MSLLKSFEHLGSLPYETITVGASIVSAVSFLYPRARPTDERQEVAVDDRPRIDVHHSDAGDAVILFDLGLFQKAEKVKRRLGEKVAHLGPSYFFEHTPNASASREEELEILSKERGRRVITVSTSKGGKDRLRVMSDPGFMDERGPTDLASFDSVPFVKQHIRFMGRAMMIGGMLAPDNRLVRAGYSKRMTAEEKRVGDPFVRGTLPEDLSDVRTGIRTLLNHSPEARIVRDSFGEHHVKHIIAVSALDDRMVDTVASHAWLEQVTGRTIPFVIDPLRQRGDHAGITDNPDMQIREIEKYLTADLERVA